MPCASLLSSPSPQKTRTTGLNDYRPVALTSVVMKSFERLVLSHLKATIYPVLDPLQFAYRANKSVDNAVNMAPHFILQHVDSTGTYARILFVDSFLTGGSNNLEFNDLKRVEIVVEFRKNATCPHDPVWLSSWQCGVTKSPTKQSRGCTSYGSWRSSTCQI